MLIISGMSTISIHKALAGLDCSKSASPSRSSISIHKALAGLDEEAIKEWNSRIDFNPQGPRGPRLFHLEGLMFPLYFNPQGPRGPRLNAGQEQIKDMSISIHKALAGLDTGWLNAQYDAANFNPQGPRGPRPLLIFCVLLSV